MQSTTDLVAARGFVLRFAAVALVLLFTTAGFNQWLDPFGFRPGEGWPPGKRDVAYLINKRVSTLAKLERQPASNLVFGDSRAAKLEDALLTRTSGVIWTNLAFGGATLEEIASLVESTMDHRRVERALVVLPFNRFTQTFGVNGIEEALRLTSQRWKLHTSIFELRASLEVAAYGLTGTSLRSSEPPMTPAAFADFQERREAGSAFTAAGQAYARKRLGHLLEAARGQGTRVIWVAPPAHARMLHLYSTRFAAEFAAYKDWMRRTAEFVDFEHPQFEAQIGTPVRFKDLLHLDEPSTDALARALMRRVSEGPMPTSTGLAEPAAVPAAASAEPG